MPGITFKKIRLIVIGMVAAFAISVPVGYWALPRVYRELQLANLLSRNGNKQHAAMVFVQRWVSEDPVVRQRAVSALAEADDESFVKLLGVLDAAGYWRYDVVGEQSYLRYIRLLTEEPDAEARILACQRLGELNGQIGFEVCKPILDELLADPVNAAVRYNALVAIGQLAHTAKDPAEVGRMVAKATGDEQTTIARHAWILLGVLKQPGPSLERIWQRPVEVTEAAIWSQYRSLDEKSAVRRANALCLDLKQDPINRGMGIYATRKIDSDDMEDLHATLLDIEIGDVTPDNQLIIWRTILSARDVRSDRFYGLLDPFAATTEDGPLVEPLIYASTYRLGFPYVRENDTGRLKELAAWEGFEVDSTKMFIAPNTPDMLRLAAIRVMKNPGINDLLVLFESDQPTIRNLACVLATSRLSADEQNKLIVKLLTSYSDAARQCGAIIFGMAPEQVIAANPDLIMILRKKIEDEDVWAVKQVLKLGIWMRGGADYPETLGRDLLAREDLPATTILLGLMTRQPAEGLDYLLNPLGDEPEIKVHEQQTVDLRTLLCDHRWWYVVDHFLPGDAPQYWLWGDPQLQAFQLDVLRDWYLVNRYRFLNAQR